MEVPIAATALGARIIEKHLRGYSYTVDSDFSLWPEEFKTMVDQVHRTWAAMRIVQAKSEEASRPMRRSLYVVEDMKQGDVFTVENLRSIRPAFGLPPNDLKKVLGKKATIDIERGTPLAANLFS